MSRVLVQSGLLRGLRAAKRPQSRMEFPLTNGARVLQSPPGTVQFERTESEERFRSSMNDLGYGSPRKTSSRSKDVQLAARTMIEADI